MAHTLFHTLTPPSGNTFDSSSNNMHYTVHPAWLSWRRRVEQFFDKILLPDFAEFSDDRQQLWYSTHCSRSPLRSFGHQRIPTQPLPGLTSVPASSALDGSASGSLPCSTGIPHHRQQQMVYHGAPMQQQQPMHKVVPKKKGRGKAKKAKAGASPIDEESITVAQMPGYREEDSPLGCNWFRTTITVRNKIICGRRHDGRHV
ncbi:hypothetical protein LTR56_005389 [Elasticomyces elasticus]|nr:hypothetical protein LTR22_020621 [Elasticomyces elasticus]KAK3651881.1 hypothetical protein LTR56_005389 [Elasticomyces elasticus]KAK4927776.1 hypothetical protein LTR49_005401 [Elasticomyces elasticus]KAK5761447.1 hypothetical protein LTS12_008409 [Elasticomyces elasticus]